MSEREHIFETDRGGASAVEFALIAPVLIFILVAIFGYGLMFMTAMSLNQLGADAARSTIAGLSLEEKRQLASSHLAIAASDYILLEPDAVTFNLTEGADRKTTKLEVIYQPESHPIRYFEGILPIPDMTFRSTQSIREHR